MIKTSACVYTDVLVVGGGIGGLCAAIAAAEQGVKVTVVEKANTKRSGSGATGNDHFLCYYPKVHGDDIKLIIKEALDSMIGLCHDPSLTKVYLERSLELVQLWESWGIKMRPYSDDYVFMGHAYPGRPRIWLKYTGGNQKEMLTKAAKKAGATICNHHPAVELIKEGDRIVGVMCLDISGEEPTYVPFLAKKVILATGSANRLYSPAATPGSLFNTAFCTACTGAAQAQAWRIGANLCNMELPNRHAGPKHFARAGKSTWIGIYKYPDGKLLGPFVKEVNREVGDITCDVWSSAYTDLLLDGRGPAYIDCSQTSKAELEFMRHGMVEEGLTGFLNYIDENGIDPAQHAVEFMQYEPHLIGRGLEINEHAQTSIKGLYATGDMVGNVRGDISGAAVFGWIAGQHAANNLDCDFMGEANLAQNPVNERKEYYQSFYKREGAPWKEANMALQQIMNDYAAAGPHRKRSETLLTAGLKYLGDLRKNIDKYAGAKNTHELLRLIETIDLIDNGEVIMHGALERKETRGMHIRADYTFTNPLLNDKFLIIHQENNKPVCTWRTKF